MKRLLALALLVAATAAATAPPAQADNEAWCCEVCDGRYCYNCVSC